MSFAGSVGDARRVAVGPGSQFHKATRGFPGRLRVAFRSLAMRPRWSGDTWRQFLRCLSTSPEVRVQVLCALITDEPQQCHRGRATECSADHVSCLISRRHVRIDRRDATTGLAAFDAGPVDSDGDCAVARWRRRPGTAVDRLTGETISAMTRRGIGARPGSGRRHAPVAAPDDGAPAGGRETCVDGILRRSSLAVGAGSMLARTHRTSVCGISFRYASFLGCQECHASDRSGAGRGSPSWLASRRAGARDAGGSGTAGLVFVGVRSGKVLARDAAAASGAG